MSAKLVPLQRIADVQTAPHALILVLLVGSCSYMLHEHIQTVTIQIVHLSQFDT